VVETGTGRIRALPDTSKASVEALARETGLGPCLSGFSTAFDGFGRCAGEILAHCEDLSSPPPPETAGVSKPKKPGSSGNPER
jgi:hypothetical protein